MMNDDDTTPFMQAISAGEGHSCGVSESGAGYCWGKKDHGRTDVPGGVSWKVARRGWGSNRDDGLYTWDVLYFVTQKVMKQLWTNHILDSRCKKGISHNINQKEQVLACYYRKVTKSPLEGEWMIPQDDSVCD